MATPQQDDLRDGLTAVDTLQAETHTTNDTATDDDTSIVSIEETRRRVYDLSLSLPSRLHAVQVWFADDPHCITEIIGTLISTFAFTNTGQLGKYITHICRLPCIPTVVQLETVAQLCLAPKRVEQFIALLADMCVPRPRNVPILLYADKLFILARYDAHTYQPLFVQHVLQDDTVPDTLRFSLLSQSQHAVHAEFFQKGLLAFLQCTVNDLRFHLLACESLLALHTHDDDDDRVTMTDEEYTDVVQLLKDVVTNTTDIEMKYRGDAADMLARYVPGDIRIFALDALTCMGAEGLGVLSTMYDNKQNAHAESMDESLGDMVRFLETHATDHKCDLAAFSLADMTARIRVHAKTLEEVALLDFAIYRMEHQVGYCTMGYTLKDVCGLVYAFIEGSEYREALEMRMCEELMDMSQTCTTGYYKRLLNVLSGFSGLQLRISWSEQIQANLVAQLNTCIRDSPYVDVLLEELTVENLCERPTMMALMREHIPRIRASMATEFLEHIPLDVFDFEFRKALLAFEGIGINDVSV
jgi:hypothetical protein